MMKSVYYLLALWQWLIGGCRFASQEEAVARHDTCLRCPLMTRDEYGDEVCSVCGCLVTLETYAVDKAFSKVHFPREHCDKGKW